MRYRVGIVAALLAAGAAGACDGKPSAASRSADRYDEAVEKGVTLDSRHGGHSQDHGGTAPTTGAAEHQHRAPAAEHDHGDIGTAGANDDAVH